MGDFGQAIENNLAVAGKVFPTIHTAVWSELSNDWENQRGATITKGVVATGVGVGLGLLCSRAPVLGREIMALAGMTQLTRLTTSGISLIQMASAADTEAQRVQVASAVRHGIAGEAALLVETLPGALLGAKGGALVGRRYGLASGLAGFGQGLEAWQRKTFGDMFTYRGPGSGKLAVAGEETGSVDLLKLGDRMNDAFAATDTRFGVRQLEQARIWKLGAGGEGEVKVGQTILGRVRADNITSGQEVRLGRYADNVSHPHRDGDITLSTGDFNAVKKDGIVVAHADDGSVMIFGNGKEGLGNANSIWQSLVTQPSESVALRVTSKWNPRTGLEPVAIQPVAWAQAERMLRSYRGGPLNLEGLQMAPHVTAQSPAARALMNRLFTPGAGVAQ